MSKGKKRREARRRARLRRAEQEQEGPAEEGVSAEAEDVPEASERHGGEPAHAAAPGVRHSRPARRRAKPKAGAWERMQRVRVSPLMIATPIVATVVGVLVVLIVTSGSSGTTEGGGAIPTPDPRVAGTPPAATVNLDVNDVNFSLREITGKAGEVIELVVTNTGTISHNLVVAGPDNEYDTKDDFNPVPWKLDPGDTGRVKLVIDDPGTYLFRCAFHPTIEFGTLTLE